MATLGNFIVKELAGHSSGEKATRPWWDTLGDFLLLGLVLLGIIVCPTALVYTSPLACTLCLEDNCKGKFSKNEGQDVEVSVNSDPGFSLGWVAKFCTHSSVDRFIFYFPFILLLMGLFILLIERTFINLFKSGLALESFYNLIAKEVLNEASKNSISDQNSKGAIDISLSFHQSSKFFLGYTSRSVSKFIIAGALFGYLLYYGLPIVREDELIYCDVHGYGYECAGYHKSFHLYSLIIALGILLGLLFCCFFNLLWIFVTPLRKLRRAISRANGNSSEGFGVVFEKSRDLKILLDLLAETSGVPTSIKLLSLFDEEIENQCKVRNVRADRHGEQVAVSFEEARIKRKFSNTNLAFFYIAEILPSSACRENSIVVFDGREMTKSPFLGFGSITSALRKNSKSVGITDEMPMKTTFEKVNEDEDITVVIRTTVNGRTIGIVRKKMGCSSEDQVGNRIIIT